MAFEPRNNNSNTQRQAPQPNKAGYVRVGVGYNSKTKTGKGDFVKILLDDKTTLFAFVNGRKEKETDPDFFISKKA